MKKKNNCESVKKQHGDKSIDYLNCLKNKEAQQSSNTRNNMYRNDLILRLNCIPQNMTCEGVKGALNEPPFVCSSNSSASS